MSESNPRLFRLLLEVSELERAVTFYSELLGTTGQPVRGGRHYFDCGGVIVGLVDVSPAGRCVRGESDRSMSQIPMGTGCASSTTQHYSSGRGLVSSPSRPASSQWAAERAIAPDAAQRSQAVDFSMIARRR